MAIKTPLDMAKIKNHFAYGAWKYLLLIIAAIFGWNLIYTTTAPRVPREKRVDLYVASNSVNTEVMGAWLEEVRQSDFPDMELLDLYTVMAADSGDPYAQMQLSTFIMAGEGDVYLLDRERFQSFAAQGAMVPLEDLVAQGGLAVEGIDLGRGYVTVADTGERHLFGIPADSLYGLISRFGLDCRGMVLSAMASSPNQGNALKLMDYLIRHMQEPAPEWLAAPTATP